MENAPLFVLVYVDVLCTKIYGQGSGVELTLLISCYVHYSVPYLAIGKTKDNMMVAWYFIDHNSVVS